MHSLWIAWSAWRRLVTSRGFSSLQVGIFIWFRTLSSHVLRKRIPTIADDGNVGGRCRDSRDACILDLIVVLDSADRWKMFRRMFVPTLAVMSYAYYLR